jgi:hypothetical protein
MKKQPLEPLIPLAAFGKLVRKIANVPKDAVTARKAQAERPKPKRQPKRS